MTDQQTVEGGLDEPAELEPLQGTLELAAPEDRHDRAEWEAAAAAVLRKARRLSAEDRDALVWERLTRRTLDGIAITPLGTPELLDGLGTTGRPTRVGAWDIRSYLSLTDAKTGNEEILAELEGGATSLWLSLPQDIDLEALLDGVLLDLAPVVLDSDGDCLPLARKFLEYAAGRTLHPATNLGLPVPAVLADMQEGWELVRDSGLLGYVVDGRDCHLHGASEVQELGYVMAVAVEALRAVEAADRSIAEVVPRLEFRLAATQEQFPTIAKFRAARRLWRRVLELCATDLVDMRIHAVTSEMMMTAHDPWVNLLRTTVAAFAAGVGGADAVTVLPFDGRLGTPDALGRRIARNTSHLLIDEAHVAKVADPAAGGYVVEKLTDDLAEAAWEEFVRIDGERPGIHRFYSERVTPVREQRQREIALRTRPITGVSEFPNLDEKLPERSGEPWISAPGYAEPFEELRRARPTQHVFLATMGPIAAHTARATFAANLLAAGGIAVDVAGATETVEDLVAAYDGQKVVCLAGTDAAYDEWADEAARALREAGATWVVVAGRPRESTDDSCAMGVDALEFLGRTREKLG